MRLKPDATDIIQLAVLALTEEPAINIAVSLDPLPEMWKDSTALFPLKLPLLDRSTPFYLDVTTFYAAEERLGPNVRLRVEYEDLAGNDFNYTATLDVRSITPWKLGTPANEKMASSSESIDKTLKAGPSVVRGLGNETAELRGGLETLTTIAFAKPRGTPSEVAAQLSTDASALLLAAKNDGTIVFSPYLGGTNLHAGTTQFISPPND